MGKNHRRLALIAALCCAWSVFADHSLEWVRDPIELNDYNREYKLGPAMPEVRYVTIHNTAEPFAAAQERDRVDFRRDGASVSFHFAVDEEEAVQILPLTHGGWHAGDGWGEGNTASIGVEICRSQWRGADAGLYSESEENAAVLAAALLDFFDLPTENLRMHRDWNGKYCPHRILESDAWEIFKTRVDEVRREGYDIEFRSPETRECRPALLLHGERRDNGEASVYRLTTGREFDSAAAAAAYLAEHGCDAMVSSWVRGDDGMATLKALQDAGVAVRYYFAYDTDRPDHERRNLAEREP